MNKFIQMSELNFSPEPKTCRQTRSSLDQSDRLWKYSECHRMGSKRHQKLWPCLQLPSWSRENQLWLIWGTIDPWGEEQDHKCLTLVEKWGTAPLFATSKGKSVFTEHYWCHWTPRPTSSLSERSWSHPGGSSQCFWTTCPHLEEQQHSQSTSHF